MAYSPACRARRAAKTRDWRAANKEHVAAYQQAYREANKDRERAAAQAYRSTHKEQVSATKRSWQAANKEHRAEQLRAWKAENKERVAASERTWRKENQGAKRALIARRRAATLARTPAWADQKAIKAIYAEAARLTRESGIEHHVDHVIPLQGQFVSGLHVETNLQILTATANHQKFNRFDINTQGQLQCK